LLLVIIGAAIVCSTSNYVAAKRAQPSGGGISGLDSSANVIQSRRLADEQKEKEVFSHNSQLYWSLKKFVDDHRVIKFPPPSIGDGYMVRYEQASARLEWEELTRPFRVGQLLTREQRDALLDFLGKGVVNEALKSDPSYSQAIDDLGKWEF
jgi:hypothetical protein